MTAAELEGQSFVGNHQAFEAVSVRESSADMPYSAAVDLNGSDGPAPQGSLFSANASVQAYLLFAFKINDSGQARAIWDRLPAWAKFTRFKMEGRSAQVPTRDQLRLMVQSVLRNDFGLRTHVELQEREACCSWSEVPNSSGPSLRPHDASNVCEANDASSADAPSAKPGDICAPVIARKDGRLEASFTGVTMDEFAANLSGLAIDNGLLVPHTGANRTGLIGRFDIKLRFTPEDDSIDSSSEYPPFDDALKKELGLKLVRGRGQVPTIVIDHLEKPASDAP